MITKPDQANCIRCRRGIPRDYPTANGLCDDCEYEDRAEANEHSHRFHSDAEELQ